MEEKKTPLKSWMFTLLGILAILFLFATISNYLFSEDVPIGYDCFYEDAVLQKQYIDTTSSKHGGDCSKGCLFMDVYSEDISFMRCGHIENIEWKNKTYFFANEGIRKDLQEGDKIRVKWCYVANIISCDKNTLNGCHRIRGVSKIE
jgi:hypothetical protein